MTAAARDTWLEYIASPNTRSRLHAYIRRRGLTDSADDLVQTVLCDALAVEAIPSEEAELPRFITGIARNKVADEHRRRSRWRHADLPELHEQPRHEESDLLRLIDSELVDPREREALGWMMREQAGDSLYEIARERALEPDTLRQRICRLRKRLRARYLVALGLALGLGLGLGLATLSEPTLPLVSVSDSPLAAYAGEWRVSRVEPAKYAAMQLRVRIDGHGVRVYSSSEILTRELVIERATGREVVLRSGSARWVATLERLTLRHIELRSPRGFVVLER